MGLGFTEKGKILSKAKVASFHKSGNIKVMYAVAKVVVSQLQRNVLKKLIKIPPKGDAWATRALDPRPLVNTQEYIDAFRAVKTENGAAMEGDYVLHRRLEYGTRKMRPRPHLQPTMEKLRNELSPVAGKEVMRVLFGK